VAATLFTIEQRRKERLPMPSGPTDFVLRQVGQTDPGCVLSDPALSLYCLDVAERCGLFVRTPPEVDLGRASFLYQAQYETASEVVSVPFEEMHRLAAAVPMASERLVFVHSTGRCGSTLVSLALSSVPGVVSLSEPDAYYQLHQLRDAGDPELPALACTCTALLCAPRPARTWAIKFRSPAIELAGPMLALFPQARFVFLYRQADDWARSAARAYQSFGRPMFGPAQDSTRPPRTRSIVDPPGPLASPAHPAAQLAWIWATSMARAAELQRQGVPMFIARYEDLTAQPVAILQATLAYCGLTCGPDVLAEVIARDSQEGTVLARGAEKPPANDLTEERRLEFRRYLREMAPQVDPDRPMPGTYRS
jgi:hypothetical protein